MMTLLTDMEFWETLDVTRGRMALNRPKVVRDLDLTLGAQIFEVLVTENDQFPLSSIQCQLVQAGLRQLRDLNPMNLSAYV